MLAPNTGDFAHLEAAVANRKDLFHRTAEYAQKKFIPVQPGVMHPTTIREWLEKHPQYEYKG